MVSFIRVRRIVFGTTLLIVKEGYVFPAPERGEFANSAAHHLVSLIKAVPVAGGVSKAASNLLTKKMVLWHPEPVFYGYPPTPIPVSCFSLIDPSTSPLLHRLSLRLQFATDIAFLILRSLTLPDPTPLTRH
jgi:hypothetical protein